MKCKSGLLVLCLCLAFFALGISQAWGQESQPSNPPASSWSALDLILTQLETEATNLDADSTKLKELLDQASKQLIALSSKLDESRMQASALSTSLEKSASSLTDSIKSLNQERSRLTFELWIWRGSTALAVIGIIAALLK